MIGPLHVQGSNIKAAPNQKPVKMARSIHYKRLLKIERCFGQNKTRAPGEPGSRIIGLIISVVFRPG